MMKIREPAQTITDRADRKLERLKENIDYTRAIGFPFIVAAVGQPGSGKTTFILNLLEDYEKYHIIDHLSIFTGTRDQIAQFEKFKNVEIHTEFDPIKMSEYIHEIENYQMLREQQGKPPLKYLFVFDDFITTPGIVSRSSAGVLEYLASVYRHLSIGMIITSQKYTYLSQPLRSVMTSHTIIFSAANSDLKKWAEEHANSYFDEDDLLETYRMIRKNGFGNFTVINYKAPEENRVQWNFKPVHLEEIE